jgi:uncharacterized membrane protein YtjA (UPF0391 family)
MFRLSFIILSLALLAAIFGFSGISQSLAGVSKFSFYLLSGILLLLLVLRKKN